MGEGLVSERSSQEARVTGTDGMEEKVRWSGLGATGRPLALPG